MQTKLLSFVLGLCLTPITAFAATAQPQDILEPVGTALKDLEQENPVVPENIAGNIYKFEPLVVSEQLRREMAYRTMRLGLSRSRSERFEDADKIVCRFYNNIRSRVRKHLQCATNRTFHFWAQDSKRRLFRNHREMAPYTVYHGPIYNINTVSKGKIRAMIRGVTSQDTLAENETKLLDYVRARAVGMKQSRQGFENAEIVAFAKAYQQLKEIDSSSGFQKVSDAHAESIIIDAGLDVDTYNRIAEAAETDEPLASAILRATDINL